MDPLLLARFVDGDEEAFDEIFARFGRDVWRVVRRFFNDAWDREEAFQEIWLDVYRKRDRFDAGRADEIGAWLRMVARNRCLDLLDARGARPPAAGDGETADLMGPDPEPRAGLDGEIRRAVERFAATLDEEERRVFELCFVEERSHEEVAGLLGITERRSKYLKKKLLLLLEQDPALRSLGE